MSFISILLIIMTIIAGISTAFAISFYLDKRYLKRRIKTLSNTMDRDKKDWQLSNNRERDLNMEVFRLSKKLRRRNRI